MKRYLLALAATIGLSACSETPLGEQSVEERKETERQVVEDAQSLEQAADEAVKVLEAEIDTELADEGLTATAAPASEDSADTNEESGNQ